MDKKENIHKLINKIINTKINNILNIINKNYPTKFKKEHIDIELNYIKNNINLIDTINKINLSSDIKEKKNKNKKKNIKDINRCGGRIWNNNIFYKTNMKKVMELPIEFKVIDFKDISFSVFFIIMS